MRLFLPVLLLFLFGAVPLRAQIGGAPLPDSARTAPPVPLASPDRPSFIPLAGAFYSPETRLGAAIFITPVFRLGPDTATRKSTTRLLGFYTQEKQWSIQLEHSLFTPGERYAIIGSWRFYDYPIFYYGTGDNTRTADEGLVQYKLVTLSQRVLRRVGGGGAAPATGGRRLFVGPQVLMTSLWDIDATQAPKLAERPARELQSTLIVGAGPVLLLDTRDRLTFPTTGAYAELSATFTGFGGDYSFGRYVADLRRYVGLDGGRGKHVLAVQAVGQFHVGEVPFRELAPLGGISLLRGYYEGRYRGRQLAAAQAEYRFPVWRRFGGVAFGAIGDVGHRLRDFNQPRVAGGAGIRFTFNRRERLNVRADYGIGQGGSGGFYFSIGEAF